MLTAADAAFFRPPARRRGGRAGWARRALLAAAPALLATPLALRAQTPPPAAAAPAAGASAYVACLGCAEHDEIRTRWHRPFLAELGAESAVAIDHFRLEAQARGLGLCETDVLIRSPSAVNGCHPYSTTRALLVETPIELAAFTSPAWGLERRGHPRWAMLAELLPMSYHLFSIRQTTESIHFYQREQVLFH